MLDPEIFPPGYILDLNEHRIKMHFPNLQIGVNGFLKSLKTDDYNCAAWAAEIEDEWVQFNDHDGSMDLRLETYVNYYKKHGFEKTENKEFEQGVIKIVIFSNDNGEFKHVARLLPSGVWTSKMGDWEDIEHDTPEAVAGSSYGKPVYFMSKINSEKNFEG